MNLSESLPPSGTPDLAALAAKSAVLRRAASLASWAGGGKRTLTAKGVLRKQDVSAAAAIIGVKAPQAVRSAADLPELHVAWCAAIGMGLLTVEGGKASGGPELKSWPPDDGTGLLEAWLKGFFAVSAVVGGGDRDLGRDFLVLVLALLNVLQDEAAPAGRGLLREVLEEADEICDSRDLDADVHGALSRLSSPGVPRIEGLTALLADFGIIAKARPTASKAPAVTPLGEWVASCLAEVCPVPLDARLTAEELIEGAANFPADERETLADSWLDARDPADAVREILSAAEEMPSRLRVVALELAEMTGEDGWPAWRGIAGDEARPHAARHARVFLFSMGQGPEPARADWQWVGAEAAAAALHEAGPALSQTGGHGDPRPPELGCCLGGGHMAEVVDGVDALRRAARERLCSGAHAIKRHRDHDSRGGEHPPSHRKLPAEPRQVGLARAAMAGWLGGCPQADEVVLVASAARRRSMRRSPRCWTARSRPFAEIRKRTLAHDCTDANRAKLLGTAWRVS